jgi:DNA invertase Pin-like site-specific DNA recombinase
MISKTKATTKRAALYVRVSSDSQTVQNQLAELRRAVEYERWQEVAVYADEGISGTVDRRPGLDGMLEDAKRGKFDVVMVRAIDRLGRSASGLIKTVQLIHNAKVDLFLMRERIDTTTDTGELLFTIMAAHASFERKTIRRRAEAGLDRVKAELAAKGTFTARKSGIARSRLGRPDYADPKALARARELLAGGMGILRAARETGLGTGTVHKIARELRGA